MARRKETFIVHVWIDAGAGEAERGAACRGSVEHLSTGKRLYFAEPSELIEFLRRCRQPGAV